jgi:hypothetical protein
MDEAMDQPMEVDKEAWLRPRPVSIKASGTLPNFNNSSSINRTHRTLRTIISTRACDWRRVGSTLWTVHPADAYSYPSRDYPHTEGAGRRRPSRSGNAYTWQRSALRTTAQSELLWAECEFDIRPCRPQAMSSTFWNDRIVTLMHPPRGIATQSSSVSL